MESLLEELRPEIKKQLYRHAGWKELTLVCLNGINGQAIAVTNRSIYLFQKRVIGIKTNVIPLTRVNTVKSDQNKLLISGKSIYSVSLPTDKQDLVIKVKQVIENLCHNRPPYTF